MTARIVRTRQLSQPCPKSTIPRPPRISATAVLKAMRPGNGAPGATTSAARSRSRPKSMPAAYSSNVRNARVATTIARASAMRGVRPVTRIASARPSSRRSSAAFTFVGGAPGRKVRRIPMPVVQPTSTTRPMPTTVRAARSAGNPFEDAAASSPTAATSSASRPGVVRPREPTCAWFAVGAVSAPASSAGPGLTGSVGLPTRTLDEPPEVAARRGGEVRTNWLIHGHDGRPGAPRHDDPSCR